MQTRGLLHLKTAKNRNEINFAIKQTELKERDKLGITMPFLFPYL